MSKHHFFDQSQGLLMNQSITKYSASLFHPIDALIYSENNLIL